MYSRHSPKHDNSGCTRWPFLCKGSIQQGRVLITWSGALYRNLTQPQDGSAITRLLARLFRAGWQFITVTSKWAWWHLKSPASRLFTQPFAQTQIKENIKAPRHWPLCWEFTGDRTNGQLRGKCFHLMTSSWLTGMSSLILMYTVSEVIVTLRRNPPVRMFVMRSTKQQIHTGK